MDNGDPIPSGSGRPSQSHSHGSELRTEEGEGKGLRERPPQETCEESPGSFRLKLLDRRVRVACWPRTLRQGCDSAPRPPVMQSQFPAGLEVPPL